MKDLPQPGLEHAYGRSPVCLRLWTLRFAFLLKTRPQVWQVNIFSSFGGMVGASNEVEVIVAVQGQSTFFFYNLFSCGRRRRVAKRMVNNRNHQRGTLYKKKKKKMGIMMEGKRLW